MDLDPDAAYQTLAARDARFDGRLFVGVTSTGVYCRPICRVRTPQRRHCRFFASAAQAEAAAFRPCMKCRPEIAPGPGLPWSVMDASRTLALPAAQVALASGFRSLRRFDASFAQHYRMNPSRLRGSTTDAPPGDVAVLKALRRCDGALTPRAALAQAEAWRPWRAYVVLRLWNSLSPAP